MTNYRILFLFATLVVLALISAVGAQIYSSWILDGAWYLGKTKTLDFAWNVLTFFILYNNLIPISLQVTLEIVRVFQASYINQVDIKEILKMFRILICMMSGRIRRPMRGPRI